MSDQKDALWSFLQMYDMYFLLSKTVYMDVLDSSLSELNISNVNEV